MKNILIIFLLLFSLDCIAQDSTNSINFKFQDDYFSNPPSLYLKCRNDIYFTISEDTNLEKLSYKVGGGSLIIQDSSKVISLIPTASKLILEVFYNEKIIINQKFNVKLIPKPVIKLAELSDKALTKFPQKMTINVLSDETFQKELPNDANYEIKEYRVSLATEKRLVAQKVFTLDEEFTKEEIRNYTELIKAEPNENWRLVVEVSEIQRINYNDEPEKVYLGHWGQGEVFTLPIELE